MKKVLVITPHFPFPKKGACEQDRGVGIETLVEMGYEVEVITKIRNKDILPDVERVSRELGIRINPVEYKLIRKNGGKLEKIIWYLKRIFLPWHWDGAASEYWDKEIHQILQKRLTEFSPDVVWVDYTYLWPLYFKIRRKGVRIITRSINVESNHFLEEDGASLLNYIKFIPKVITEILVSRMSDIVLSINLNEKKVYEKFGAKKVENLPLRGLNVLTDLEYFLREKPLHVYFMGSTYNVAHNKEALLFLLDKVIPEANMKMPGDFVFHITGAKFPEDVKFENSDLVKYEGFVDDKDAFLRDMDIAIVPSLFGAGMQQKIFEPLYLGIPTVTHKRGLGGYPFYDKEDLLIADTSEDFVRALSLLKDKNLRERFSNSSKNKSREMFNREKVEGVIKQAIES